MGNIKDIIKTKKIKAYNEIFKNNLCSSLLPAGVVAVISSAAAFVIKYAINYYESYWYLFTAGIKLLINMIPTIFSAELIVYIFLVVKGTLVDIKAFNKENK